MNLKSGDLVWVHRGTDRVLGIVSSWALRHMYEVESLIEGEFLGNYPMTSLTMLSERDLYLLKSRLERATRACENYRKKNKYLQGEAER